MNTTIAVKSRREGDAIRRGLERADVRAFVLIMGELDSLPDDRTRARVLRYVVDKLDHMDDAKNVLAEAK